MKHENVFKEEVFEDKKISVNEGVSSSTQVEEDEFDLNDISAQPKEQSRENIIAAEAAAFAKE